MQILLTLLEQHIYCYLCKILINKTIKDKCTTKIPSGKLGLYSIYVISGHVMPMSHEVLLKADCSVLLLIFA